MDKDLGLRRSALLESVRLMEDLLHYNVQTIVFARSRRSVELVLTYLRQRLQENNISPIDGSTSVDERIRGYRSGYLPRQRREIERGLRQGEVRAAHWASASVSSTWSACSQRGRAAAVVSTSTARWSWGST